MAQSEQAPPGVQPHSPHSLHQPAGRTVRELVETRPELVTDSWCRQVAADLLHALEARQALDRPHSIIMPDTVIVHDGGAAELLASLDDDGDFPAAFQPPIASDLKAIAALLHYAITGESPPGAALVPRGLPAFSDALLDTIDACLHGERSRRPQSIDAMRTGLGLPVAAPVAVEPAPTPATLPAPAPVSAAEELEAAIAGLAEAVGAAPAFEPEPAFAPEPASPVALAKQAPLDNVAPAPPTTQTTAVPPKVTSPEAHPAAPARLSRPLLACLAIGILGAAGFAIYEKGRQAGAEAVLAANAVAPAAAVVAPAVAPAPAPVPVPTPAVEAIAASGDSAPTSVAEPAVAPAAPISAARPAASVTYKLNIKPWGEVYVDGVKRGISPPLKTLTLRGAHTVRIDNPDFPSHTITLQPGTATSTRIEHDFQ